MANGGVALGRRTAMRTEIFRPTAAPGLCTSAPTPPRHPEKISRRGAVVEVQHAAQALATQHCSMMARLAFIWHDQLVAKTLVVSFAVIMQNELVNRFAQRPLPEEDHALQAGLLDAADESLGVRIQIR